MPWRGVPYAKSLLNWFNILSILIFFKILLSISIFSKNDLDINIKLAIGKRDFGSQSNNPPTKFLRQSVISAVLHASLMPLLISILIFWKITLISILSKSIVMWNIRSDLTVHAGFLRNGGGWICWPQSTNRTLSSGEGKAKGKDKNVLDSVWATHQTRPVKEKLVCQCVRKTLKQKKTKFVEGTLSLTSKEKLS